MGPHKSSWHRRSVGRQTDKDLHTLIKNFTESLQEYSPSTPRARQHFSIQDVTLVTEQFRCFQNLELNPRNL